MMASCVSTQKYNRLNAELMRTDDERTRAIANGERLQDELQLKASEIQRQQDLYDSLLFRYQNLVAEHNRLRVELSSEAARMADELNRNASLLSDKERRMAELEKALREREEALGAIRRKVADALLGFEGKGLTVTQRDGNVYVSMEDKLLFRSGSYEIDPEGARAVRELGKVLAENPDINIMVEGHTDNVPYRGTGQLRDNLDLSVKRATTVTRLLLENAGIDPARITSAGRGEYLPLSPEDSSEARQRNRRTEIILTPKISELLKIMED